MRLWLALIVMLMAAPLRADPTCEAIAALGRVAAGSRAGDLAGLDRALRRIDTERAMWDLRGHPLARHRADLDAALRLAEEAVALARRDGDAAARARLAAPAARAVQGRLVLLLARHACAPERAAGPQAVPEAEERPGPAAGDGLAGMRMADLAGLGLGTLVLAGLGTLLGRVLARRNRRRRRQARRHAVNLPARLRAGRSETETRLVDISRLGAKLRLDPEFEPGPLGAVIITLGDRRIGARARWRNRHYVGVQFLRPLPEDAVAPILTLPEPEGAAPQPG